MYYLLLRHSWASGNKTRISDSELLEIARIFSISMHFFERQSPPSFSIIPIYQFTILEI